MLYQKHFIYSLLLHFILLAILIVSFEFSSPMPVVENSHQPNEIINAMIVESQKRIQPNPAFPPPSLSPKAAKVVPPSPPKTNTEAIVIPDKMLKKRIDDLRRKQLLTDLKKQTEHHKKQKLKEMQAEFAKELKEMNAKSLQQQMLKEQQRLAASAEAKMSGVVDKYKALILQAIAEHWLVPPNTNKKLTAELLIRLAPGGTVLDVQLMKSSGDEGLDRSAQTAVFKASPLPVPPEAGAFEAFRQFVLKVKPENILAKDNWMS